jgi:hypothetical protein
LLGLPSTNGITNKRTEGVNIRLFVAEFVDGSRTGFKRRVSPLSLVLNGHTFPKSATLCKPTRRE